MAELFLIDICFQLLDFFFLFLVKLMYLGLKLNDALIFALKFHLKLAFTEIELVFDRCVLLGEFD